MKDRQTERRPGWWSGWLALGLVIAAGGLISNGVFGRFPLYFYKGTDPLIAIPLGAVLEMAVWILLLLAVGAVTELARRLTGGGGCWHLGARVWVMLGLEIYVVKSVFDICFRDGLFRNFEVYWPDDEPRIVALITVALLAAVIFARARRKAPAALIQRDELKIALFCLFLTLGYGYLYHRWMSTTDWPLPGVGIGLAVILLLTVAIGWRATRCRRPVSALAVGLALVSLIAVGSLTLWYRLPSPSERNHIIITIWDTTRSSRMSLYGYEKETTPGLEELASHAVIFDNAFSTSNYTYPAHVSLFTGKNYREHNYHIGSGEEYERYRGETVLADNLRRSGYQTALFSENPWVLMADKGFGEIRFFPIMGMYASGRDKRECEVGVPVKIIKYFNPFLGRRLVDAIIYRFDGFYSFTIDEIILRQAQKLFIKSRRRGPVFLCWNLMNVHNRYHPFTDWEHGENVDDYDFAREYDLAVLRSDQRTRELYRRLERSGELKRTLLVITSDHGEFLGEAGLWGHHLGLFEPVLRVPLVFIHPDLEGQRVTAPVSLPALRSLLEDLAGRNNAPTGSLIAGRLKKPGTVISEHGYLPEEAARGYRWCYTVITDDYQYIHDPLIPTYHSRLPSGTVNYLYRKPFPVGDERNRYRSDREAAARLEEVYSDYLAKMGKGGETPAHSGAAADREMKLRALGYLQ